MGSLEALKSGIANHPEVVLSGAVSTVDTSTTPSWGFAKAFECNRALQAVLDTARPAQHSRPLSRSWWERGFQFSSVIFFVLKREQTRHSYVAFEEVVLVRLHELGWNQLHVMALFAQHTSKEVRP